MYSQTPNDELNDHYPLSDWILLALYVFSIFLALTSNSIILIIFYRKKKSAKSTTYALISNMAISDFLSSLCILLQWYFCSKIFFPDQLLATPLVSNQQQLQVNNRTELPFWNGNSSEIDQLKNLTFELPNSLVDPTTDKLLESSDRLPSQRSSTSNLSFKQLFQHNQTHLLDNNQIVSNSNNQLDDKIDEKQKSTDHLTFDQLKNDQPLNVQMLIGKLVTKVNLPSTKSAPIGASIRIESDQGENINKLSSSEQTSEPSSDHQINLQNSNQKAIAHQINSQQQTNNFIQQNDQFSLSNVLLGKNRASHDKDLLASLENDEILRKKRTFEESNNPSDSSNVNHFSNDFEEEQVKQSSDPIKNQRQSKLKEKLRNFVKQVMSSDKLVKSRLPYQISQMPNCGQRICAILETLQMSSYYVSTLTMAGIAYNRYNLINRPLAPKMDTTLFITTIWLTSLSMAFLASLSSLRVFVFFTSTRFIDCSIILSSNDSSAWDLRKYRAAILMIIQYILPLGCILFLYINVIKELRKCGGLTRSRHQSSSSSNASAFQQMKSGGDHLWNRRFSGGSQQTQQQIGTVNRSFTDQDIFRISLDERAEINNNCYGNLENPEKAVPFTGKEQENTVKRLPDYFKSTNLVKLTLFRHFRNNQPVTSNREVNQVNKLEKLDKPDKPDKLDRPDKLEKLNDNQASTTIKNKRMLSLMNKRTSSNDSHHTFMSNQSQSVSAKLNLLDNQLDRTKRRLTKMMIIVVSVFAVAWLPVHLMHIKQFFIDANENANYCNSSFIYLFFYFVAFSTNTYDPVIYFYFSKELRRDAIQILKSVFKVKRLLRRSDC